jgi:hypothetical protein
LITGDQCHGGKDDGQVVGRFHNRILLGREHVHHDAAHIYNHTALGIGIHRVKPYVRDVGFLPMVREAHDVKLGLL